MPESERYAVGNGTLSVLNRVIERYAPKGSEVLFLGGERYRDVASEITREFRIYRADGEPLPTRKYASSVRAHEDTRAVVAVGGGVAADVGKFVAARFSLPLILVVTSPSSVGFFVPSAMLENENGFVEVYKAEAPKFAVCEGTLLDKSEKAMAAGFGDICSRMVSLFDMIATAALFGEDTSEGVCDAVTECVGETLCANESGGLTPLTLAGLCLKTSDVIGGIGSSRLYGGGEIQLLHGLRLIKKKRGEEPRSWGEDALVLGSVAMRVYLAFLCSGAIHPHAVPDFNARVDGMSRVFSLPTPLCAERTENVMRTDLGRLAYCVGEYRRELAERALTYEKTLTFATSRLKRLYKDRGYSYNRYVTASDLSTCMRFAAELREKPTLFTVMRALGLLG